MTITRPAPRHDTYPVSLADQIFRLTPAEPAPAVKRRRRRRADAYLGPWFTVLLMVVGFALGVYVAMNTPPLSGGTLAGLVVMNVCGAVVCRVVHVMQMRRERR